MSNARNSLPLTLLAFAASSVFAASLIYRQIAGEKRTKEANTRYQVVFILGGPGSGKSTLCERVVRDFKWCHLVAVDLIRAEVDKSDSEIGSVINSKLASGKLLKSLPSELTVRVLRKAMKLEYERSGTTKFIIEAFPRNNGNVVAWGQAMDNKADLKHVILLTCPEDTMTDRLLKRGRSGDSLDIIKKKMGLYKDCTMPVIEMYWKQGKIRNVDANRTADEMFTDTSKIFHDL